jgi:hypothetical protein
VELPFAGVLPRDRQPTPPAQAPRGEVRARLPEAWQGPQSYQGAVWREVNRKARLNAAASLTHALQDSRSCLSERLDAFENFARDLPEGTSGVVVAIGERLVLLEVLAGPRTFARVFRKLLSDFEFESVGLDRPYGTPDPPAVRSFIEAVAKATREEH